MSVAHFVTPEVEDVLPFIEPICTCLTRRTTHDRTPACPTRIRAFQVAESARSFAA